MRGRLGRSEADSGYRECVLREREFSGATLSLDREGSTARFVIGLAERLDDFADAAAEGRPHDQIVRELEMTRLL